MPETVTGTATVKTSDGKTLAVEFSGTITVDPPPPPPPGGKVLTGGGQIVQGGYVIQADQWNSPSGQLAITTGGTGTAPGFRITADTENVTAPGAPGSYPSIIYGYGFKGPYTPNCKLPMQISALTPGLVMSAYETTQVPGAAFDCSYDIWFAHTKTPANQNAGLELMIWLNWGGGVGAGGPLHASNVTIGNNTYNIYRGTGNGTTTPAQTIYCLSTTPLTSITVDMYPFAQYLISQGWLASTDYLTAIDAGFETWHGCKGMTVNSFTVTIGGGTNTNYAKIATLQDGFPGVTVNAALWNIIQTGTGSVTVNNGLSLTDTANSATYVALKSNALYDLTSSQLVINLTGAGTQATTTQALLQVQDAPAANALQFFVQNGNLKAQHEINGAYTTLASATYNATTMAWLRIREASGTVYWEYATTLTGTYTVLFSEADPFTLTALYAFVQEGQYGGADAVGTSTWAALNTLLFAGSPTTGVTITPSATGQVGTIPVHSGVVSTGITLGSSLKIRTLLMSLAPASGIDEYGNPYPAGLYAANAILESLNSGGGVVWKIDQYGNILTFNNYGCQVVSTVPGLDATLVYEDTQSATQGPLLVSIAGLAGTDYFSNTFPQGIGLAGLPGGTNVVTVTDSNGNVVAGIDGTGNVVGQTITGAMDVIAGGQSITTALANAPAGIIDRGWIPYQSGHAGYPTTPIASGTPTGVLALTENLQAGRVYSIRVPSFRAAGGTDGAQCKFAIVTNTASTATVGSTSFVEHWITFSLAANEETCPSLERVFTNATAQTQTFMLICSPTGGTVQILNPTDTGGRAAMMVLEDLGAYGSDNIYAGQNSGGIVQVTGATTAGGATVTHTSTFYPAQSWCYFGSGTQANTNNTMVQGYNPAFPGNGSQYSYMDFTAVASAITAGATINWATLRLYCQSSHYSTGVTVGLFTASSVNEAGTPTGPRDQWVIGEGQVLTHTLQPQVLVDLMGSNPYLVLGPNPWQGQSWEYSGYFYGAMGAAQYSPLLTVNWTK